MYWLSNSIVQLSKIDGQSLTLSWRRALYRSQSIDLFCKSIDWFLFDNGLRMKQLKKESLFTNFFVQHVLSVCTFILFTSTRFTRFIKEYFIALFKIFLWIFLMKCIIQYYPGWIFTALLFSASKIVFFRAFCIISFNHKCLQPSAMEWV